MVASRKFLFENDFAHPEEMKKRAAVHTEDAMAAAKAEAFAAGRAEAETEQRASEEQQIGQLLTAISGQVEMLSAERAQTDDRIARDSGALAVSICRKILPTLAAQNALREIEGLVMRTIAEMAEEPRLVIRVADSRLDALQTRLDRMSSGFPGKLVLLGDDELAENDCAILWADGGTERNIDRLWSEIDQIVASLTDDQTQPAQTSPLEGLPGMDDLDEISPDAASATSAMHPHEDLTETAKQESGHG